MQEDPAVARLQLGMDTPYFGSALQVETRREREFLGDSLTQNVISGKAVLLIGTRITPEDVEKFAVQKRVHERGVFLLAQLDADIDANAMAMIELKLENSKALATRPGPWRRTWDVEYFHKALEEIYAIDVVDKFADKPGIWRTLVDSFKNIKVDPSRPEALSVEFTAVILEKDTKPEGLG